MSLRRNALTFVIGVATIAALTGAVLLVRARDADKDKLRQAQVALAGAPAALLGVTGSPQALLAGQPVGPTELPSNAKLREELALAIHETARFWSGLTIRTLAGDTRQLNSYTATMMNLLAQHLLVQANELNSSLVQPVAAKLEAQLAHANTQLAGDVSTAGRTAWEATLAIVGIAALLIVLLFVGGATARGRREEGRLRHQAFHDALTGLPNRVLALDRAEQMLARARREQLPVAALYLDLDGFKFVNDSLGHAAGDELLQVIASRLASVVREGDTVARLSGDEFLVLVEGATLDAGPELVAERLLEVLRQPIELGEDTPRQLSITASVGIASGLRGTADELLRDADLALYEAKAKGRNGYVLFSSGMQTVAQDRLSLEMDLSEALEREQLFLLYQPTFDLQSESTNGFEALLRWRHPERGVVSPEEFIPIAEQSGLIIPIGAWVLNEACRQAAEWWERGHRVGMSVNVSAVQLDSDALLDEVLHALRDSGLDPASLTLEVTETALMRDAEATAKRLHALKQLGVRIAIDDFGTGYSSLAYLRQFPADALKIDRSFINGIATSKESSALIHTLVQLGKTLEIETLAEGIEDRSQLKTLQREQCDRGQGFLFARPLDPTAAEAFLESEPAHSPAAAA